MRIRTILVPTDFSADADAALDYAIQLGKALASKIHLLHAYYVALPLPSSPDTIVTLPAQLIETVRAGARARLETLEKRVAQEGLPCESELSADDPTTAVLAAAKALPADLIIMGTRGLTGLKHLLLGSVSERTLRMAPCPVMVVKAKDR